MKFTNRSIQALKPKTQRYEAWEDNVTGFGLRVSIKGKKSWIYMYRFAGRVRRMTFGNYPKISLADAHLKHAEARKLLDTGVDPGAVNQEEKARVSRSHTVSQLAVEYLEKWAKPRKKSWKEDQRVINKDILPAWGKRKAKDITRRDVILLLDEVVDRGAPISANRTLALISKMFTFAIGRDIVDASPCVSITRPAKEKERERVLSEDEIRKFWFGLEQAKMFEITKLVFKLILVTGQRKGEVVKAKWDEVDPDAGWWVIPSSKSKNKLAHRVPLTSIAITLLQELKDYSKNSEWLFPSPRGNKSITERSVNHALRENEEILKIKNFAPHDLRRTAASNMTASGISRLVVSKVLNHSEKGVTAIYDRYSYDKEKRQALDSWGCKLESILTGKKGKVIPLAKRA